MPLAMEHEHEEFEEILAAEFREKVNENIENEAERNKLYKALGDYHESMSLELLISDLKVILHSPPRLRLFDDMRSLIPLKHQFRYDQLAPRPPPNKLKIIRLKKKTGESFGFSLRGGSEYGIGVFISEVAPNSPAANHGILPGDQIVMLNGYFIDSCIHDEVINLMKAKNELVMKLRRIGMVPSKLSGNSPIYWSFVEPNFVKPGANVAKISMNILGTQGLGCSICSGPPLKPGIFIQSVKKDGYADEVGLEVGDQILDCNGVSFLQINHAEAVMHLKGDKQLLLVIRKGAGVDLFEDQLATSRHSQHVVATRLTDQSFLSTDKKSDGDFIATHRLNGNINSGYHVNGNNIEMVNSNGNIPHRINERTTNTNSNMHNLPQHSNTQSDESSKTGNRHREKSKKKKKKDKSKLDRSKPSHNVVAEPAIRPQYMSSSEAPVKQDEVKLRHTPPKSLSMAASPSVGEALSPTDYRWKPFSKRLSSQSVQNEVISGEEDEEILEADYFDPTTLFQEDEIGHRNIKLYYVLKKGALGLAMEGGLNSPLGGRIVVAEVLEAGCLHKHDIVSKGDQLMMVDGVSLLNITLDEAEDIIGNAMNSTLDFIKIIVAKSANNQNTGREMTYL